MNVEKLVEALQKIIDMEPGDYDQICDEWGEAFCFTKAQEIAREALKQ